MKLKALWTIGLSSALVLSACGTNNDENRKDDKENETSERTDKKSNKSEQQTENNRFCCKVKLVYNAMQNQ